MIRLLILRRNNRTAKPMPANPIFRAPSLAYPLPRSDAQQRQRQQQQQQGRIDSVNGHRLDTGRPRDSISTAEIHRYHTNRRLPFILGIFRFDYDTDFQLKPTVKLITRNGNGSMPLYSYVGP